METHVLYELGRVGVIITGPLMVAIIAFMYLSVYLRTRKLPAPNRALYEYARINIARRGHAGVLVYAFVACIIFFIGAAGCLAFAKLAGS